MRLFVERARYRQPDFVLDPENAPSVAEVCRKLDGIPLAIELAAARVGTLSVAQISDRLGHSLKLLSGKDRSVPERQRTLRAALDWSYELLDEAERELFGRLSVFTGGFTLRAAEAVCAGGGIERDDVLNLLRQVTDKSLIVAEAEEGDALRNRLLETIRQYGTEKLAESGEAKGVRRRHAEYYVALAEEVEPEPDGQGAWLRRLKTEQDNFRAALRWSLGSEASARSAELGLRLALALGQRRFWAAYALSEGRGWLERGLAENGASSESVRARALYEAGWLATVQGDYARAAVCLGESRTTLRDLGDVSGAAISLAMLGQLTVQGGDSERVDPLREEAEALLGELSDERATAYLLIFLQWAAWDGGDYGRAVKLAEESLALSRTLGDLYGIALCSGSLGFVVLDKGETNRAEALFEESSRATGSAGQGRHLPLPPWPCGSSQLAQATGPRGQVVGRGGSPWGSPRHRHLAPVSPQLRQRRPPGRRTRSSRRGGLGSGMVGGTRDDPQGGNRVRPTEPTDARRVRSLASLPCGAERQGGRGLEAGSPRLDQRRGGPGALHKPQHRKPPPQLHLPQDRRKLPRRRHPLRLRTQPRVTAAQHFSRSAFQPGHHPRRTSSAQGRASSLPEA